MAGNTREVDIYESGRAEDKIAALSGIAAALLLHALVYFAAPARFAEYESATRGGDELKLEILPPEISKRPPEFVEANPFANTEKPDSPDAPDSFTDQRASDIIPDPSSKSKMPYVEGEIKDGKKIVEGTSSPEDILNPQQPFQTLQRPLEQPARVSEFPKPVTAVSTAEGEFGADSAEKSAQSEGTKIGAQGEKEGLPKSETSGEKNAFPTDKPDDTSLADEKFAPSGGGEQTINTSSAPSKKSAADGGGKPDDGAEIAENGSRIPAQEQPQPAPQDTPPTDDSLPAPKPRPYLSMRIPAGPLADNRSRANNQGTIAVDSRFSEFGAYQQRMIEAISRQWNLLGSQYDLNTAVNTMVVIEYSLDKSGNLVSISVLYSNSTNTGRGLCEQSILTTAPYGEWTREMISVLGDSNQDVRITFHYR